MSNVHPQWKIIQNLYKEKFGTEPEVIDFIAVKDILRLCCFGFMPQFIGMELLVDESYVVSVLEEYYGFSGWDYAIDVDLYSLYRSVESFEDFENYLVNFAPGNVKAIDMRLSYSMCETYENLQELLEDYD